MLPTNLRLSSKKYPSFHLVIACGAGFDSEGAFSVFVDEHRGVQCLFQRGFEFEEEAVTIAKRFLLNTGLDFGGIIYFILLCGVFFFRLDHKKIGIGPAPVDDDVRGDVFHGTVAISRTEGRNPPA